MKTSSDNLLLKTIQLLEELTVFETIEFEEFLRKLIKLIHPLIPSDSVLIYFYDRNNDELKLVGSSKSKKSLLGKITLKKGEGITGWVANHKKTVNIPAKAYEDERFRGFSELPEDRYEAFLSVPIIDKQGVVGVINIQNKVTTKFSSKQIELVESIVKIIASAFEKVSLLQKVSFLENKLEERKLIDKAKGLLMREKNISEAQAYRLLQKEAMRKRKSMKQIAEALILVFG